MGFTSKVNILKFLEYTCVQCLILGYVSFKLATDFVQYFYIIYKCIIYFGFRCNHCPSVPPRQPSWGWTCINHLQQHTMECHWLSKLKSISHECTQPIWWPDWARSIWTQHFISPRNASWWVQLCSVKTPFIYIQSSGQYNMDQCITWQFWIGLHCFVSTCARLVSVNISSYSNIICLLITLVFPLNWNII